MKTLFRIIVSSLTLTGLLAACALREQPLADTAVVNTAIAGTQQSQALVQSTVNATTLTAMPATPTPGPTIEYVTMTEEELAALIDQAVAEAVAATAQTTTAVTSTTSDNTVTAEEVVYVYDYYYYADYYVEYAEELLDEYYNLYAELANEMIAELNGIESELSQMNGTLTQISTSLDEISTTLSQGLELAQSSVDQLNTAAHQAQMNATELQTQAQDMMSTLQLDQQNRVSQIDSIQANNIPTDSISALQSGFTFIDAANTAVTDGKLSRDEMLNIAQLGKNAQAGFQQFGGNGGSAGGPDLAQFSSKFNEIMGQFAHGEMPQARANLGSFERSLGQRPSGNGLPGEGNRPNLPGGGNGPGRP